MVAATYRQHPVAVMMWDGVATMGVAEGAVRQAEQAMGVAEGVVRQAAQAMGVAAVVVVVVAAVVVVAVVVVAVVVAAVAVVDSLWLRGGIAHTLIKLMVVCYCVDFVFGKQQLPRAFMGIETWAFRRCIRKLHLKWKLPLKFMD